MQIINTDIWPHKIGLVKLGGLKQVGYSSSRSSTKILGQLVQSRFSNKHWAKTPTVALIIKAFKSAKLVLIEKQGFILARLEIM